MHFPNLNRCAMIIQPKKPFYDWLRYEDEHFDEDLLEGYYPKVVLIPDFEEEADCQKWLKKNYDKVFVDFLFGWYTDDSLWPAKRDFKLFQEWFEYRFHLMVFDADEGEMEWF